MKKRNNFFLIATLLLCISIGFAYISSNLSITGHGIFAKNTWDIYFGNLVDDYNKTEISIPANIENKTTINFSVNLEEPGSSYIFYSDIVNNGTIDAMLDTLEVTGLEEVETFLTAKITYSDDIEINQYDLLSANSKDKIKVEVNYKKDINIEDLPTESGSINLSASINYIQADENAKERSHNEDITGPTIKFVPKNEVKGNNNWYKSLSVTTKLLDSSPIKSVKYCVTTNDTCTPNTSAEVENNTFTYQLLNSSSIQTICIEATDNLDNVCTTCSKEEYKVDGEDPTISSVTVTTDDDTMRVEVVGEDDSSGVTFYYFSKDAGTTWVTSKNPNYTFTGLDEGDYLITVYVEDAAGNISDTKATSTTIRHKSWCEKNNISNLSDCIIATEANNSNIEEAKQIIEAKGSPDFNLTSPSIVYKESIRNNVKEFNSSYILVGQNYSFNKETGKFTILNTEQIKNPQEVDFSSTTYYTCMSPTGNSCAPLRKINSLDKVETSSTSGKVTCQYNVDYYEPKIDSYNNSDSGMYSAEDNDGKSYYYRGAITGNYVKFAGFYWRILRVNGNKSVRLIYDGTTLHNNSEANIDRIIGTSKFNKYNSDNTYVGYMYGDITQSKITKNEYPYGHNVIPTVKYYFSDDYSYDAETNSFSLQGNMFTSTVSDYKKNHDGEHYYTCLGTLSTSTCTKLIQVNRIESDITINSYPIENNTISLDVAESNTNDSIIKTYLDKWYQNNMTSYTNKLHSNSAFCGDREIDTGATAGAYTNLGYGGSLTVYGYRRILPYNGPVTTPRLTCPKANDNYTLKTSTTGNKKLDYPVGLITADEVKMAGASNSANNLYYLYTGYNYWTMTPGLFVVWSYAFNFRVQTDGGLYGWQSVTETYGIRPVINLDPTKITFTGTGTIQDPFIVE